MAWGDSDQVVSWGGDDPVADAPATTQQPAEGPGLIRSGLRGVAKGVAGLVDVALLGAQQHSVRSNPPMPAPGSVSEAAGNVATRVGLPPPVTSGENYAQAAGVGVGSLVGGPATVPAAAASVSGSLASEYGRQHQWSEGAQIAAGIIAGAFGGGAAELMRTRPDTPAMTRLLVNRDNLPNDREFQATLRPNWEQAAKQSTDNYTALGQVPLRTQPEAVVTPRAQMEGTVNEWGAVQPTIVNRPRFNRVNTDALLQGPWAARINDDPVFSAKINDLLKDMPDDTAGLVARGQRIRAEADIANNRSGVGYNPALGSFLSDLSTAFKNDVNDSLVLGIGRTVDRMHQENVTGPWARIRKTLPESVDPEETWKAFQDLGRSDHERLYAALDDQTREAIRGRITRALVDREEGSIGANAPTWSSMESKGLGIYFNKDEWLGMKRLTTGRSPLRLLVNAAADKSVGAVVGGTIGYGTAGPLGGAAGAIAGSAAGGAMDRFLATPRGRLMLARLGNRGLSVSEQAQAQVALQKALADYQESTSNGSP